MKRSTFGLLVGGLLCAISHADMLEAEVEPGLDFVATAIGDTTGGFEGVDCLGGPEGGGEDVTLRVHFSVGGQIRLNGTPIGSYTGGTHQVEIRYNAQSNIASVRVLDASGAQVGGGQASALDPTRLVRTIGPATSLVVVQ